MVFAESGTQAVAQGILLWGILGAIAVAVLYGIVVGFGHIVSLVRDEPLLASGVFLVPFVLVTLVAAAITPDFGLAVMIGVAAGLFVFLPFGFGFYEDK